MYMYLTAMSKFNSGHSHLDLKIRESSHCAFIFKTVLCSQLHVYNRYIRVMILIFLKIKKKQIQIIYKEYFEMYTLNSYHIIFTCY